MNVQKVVNKAYWGTLIASAVFVITSRGVSEDGLPMLNRARRFAGIVPLLFFLATLTYIDRRCTALF